MLTAQHFRDLAEGIDNANSGAEEAQEVYTYAFKVKRALEHYANHAPLDLKSCREIQADLRAIAGKRHYHKASIGSDACDLCGRNFRDAIHITAAE